MKFIYQIITAILILAVVVEMFQQKDIKVQLTAAMILIPFILRLFMIA